MAKLIYNIIVFTGDTSVGMGGYVTYHKVNSLEAFKTFITNKYPRWKFLTIYNNRTKEKIGVEKR